MPPIFTTRFMRTSMPSLGPATAGRGGDVIVPKQVLVWLTCAECTSSATLKRSGFDAASFLVRKDAGMPKKFDAATKDRALRMVTEQAREFGSVTKACAAVAPRLGISKGTLRGWARQAEVDAGARDGLSSDEREEIKALKAKVRRLEEGNAILRSAATFFAGALDPRSRRS